MTAATELKSQYGFGLSAAAILSRCADVQDESANFPNSLTRHSLGD